MLSRRLKIISQFIEPEDVVGDIGTDSGQLPIFLALHGHKYVYASDNKKGPFDNLNKKVKEANLERVIKTALRDGLDRLPKKVNTLVIAGLGGELLCEILSKGQKKLDNIKKLILAPNNSEPSVRKMLSFLGFMIIDEEVVKEGRHFYEIIVAINAACPVCNLETEFGPINIRKKTPAFKEKWKKIYLRNVALLKQDELPPHRRLEIIAEQERIKNIL